MDGHNHSLVSSRSNGLGSPVEDPPLFVAVWVVVLDSESVLMSTNVFMPEEGSSASHLGLDLESSSISDWVSWIRDSSGVDGPALVGMVVASPEDDMSVLRVRPSVDVEALSWDISDVSGTSTVVSNHLVVVTSGVLSDNSGDSDSESITSLVGDGIVSLLVSSDGSGSLVEHEPLFGVPWLVVLDSESELVSTDVLVIEEGSS